MKKSELKKMLKPLIKECIKEVIFEEGALATIITEVVKGTNQTQLIVETRQPQPDTRNLEESRKRRKQLLDSIGRDSYNGVDLFEGTTAAPASREGQSKGPLSGVSPSDPGVDISNIFSNQSSKIWKKLSGK